MRHRHFIHTAFFFLAFFLIVAPACSDVERVIGPGENFTLRDKERVRIGAAGPAIRIDRFYNSPCPPGAQCIWSGAGIAFEWSYGGETRKGINLVKAFGYRLKILKTDYKSYAELFVAKESAGTRK